MLHVAGIALMTLIINASTTGALVKFLGLARTSDLRQNILASVTHNIHKNIDENINHLKHEKGSNYSFVDWKKLKASVRLTDLCK